MSGDAKSQSGWSAKEHYDAAMSAHAQGQLDAAEAHYKAVLALHPDHPGALHRLALVFLSTGRLAEAAALYEKILAQAPDDATAHANLGHVLRSLGRNEEALAHLKRALALRPDSAETHTNLGNVQAAMNRPEDALASFAKALALNPRLAEPYNNIGNVYESLGRYGEAVVQFNKALALRPDFAPAMNNLGNALSALGRHDEAIASFKRAVAVQPRFATAHNNLGTALAALNRHDEAVVHYEKALAERPDYPAALNNLGNSLYALSRPRQSLTAFEKLLALEPDHAWGQFGAGNALQILGRLEEAREAYGRAVALSGNIPTFHRALAETKRYAEGDPQLAVMEDLAKNIAEFSESEQIELHFALAKAYDDIAYQARAFEHLVAGNSLKRTRIVYDEAAQLGALRDMASVFTAEAMTARAGQGDPSELPIFIVGMPRSGTTLVEQMLASHPAVFGAGELLTMFDLVNEGLAGAPFPQGIPSLSADDLRKFGASYIARLRKLAPSATRITDKLPANFAFAGLIHLALPRARIIHIARDPMDVCFSCYSKLFPLGLEYTFDLGELGRYYHAYETLMAHWRNALPQGAMLEVQYETLVADFENQARRIVEYCGLEWSARCLDFHLTERAVRTASAGQVRMPLFQSSIGRWRPYEAWLRPLRDALKAS